MQVSYNLVNFVRAIVERLMLTTAYNRSELTALLENVRQDLAGLHAQHDKEVPEGAQMTRDLLLEALELYDSSLQEVLNFLDSEDEVHLVNAVSLAEEANDVVLAVEDIVGTNKRMLADMVAVQVADSSLTIEQILAEAGRQGLSLSERTFRYYAMFGLLPTAEKPAGKTDARWQYYPPSTVDKLLTIRRLQSEGYSLKQIRDALELLTEPTSSSAPGQASDVPRFLKALAHPRLGDVLRRVRTAAAQNNEAGFRDAVLDYYRFILRSVFGTVDLEPALAELTPLEIQGLLRPFRGTAAPRTGRTRPPWLEGLRSPGADSSTWLTHLAQVRARLQTHAARQDAVLQPAWKAALDTVSEAERLWENGTPVDEATIDRLGTGVQGSLLFLKAYRTLLGG